MNIDRLFRLPLLGIVLMATGCATYYEPRPGYEVTYPPSVTPPRQHNGSIYQEGYVSLPLFEDRRARQVGDVLTIVLNEEISADNESEANTSKENDIDIDSPKLFGYTLPRGNGTFTLDQELKSSQEFSGRGARKQGNSMTGTISVTVAHVFPNGNLMVRGQKWIRLNQDNEYIQISGIVRPEDIDADNIVLSTQVADARIVYQGKGPVASASKLGWLARFFLAPIWPY